MVVHHKPITTYVLACPSMCANVRANEYIQSYNEQIDYRVVWSVGFSGFCQTFSAQKNTVKFIYVCSSCWHIDWVGECLNSFAQPCTFILLHICECVSAIIGHRKLYMRVMQQHCSQMQINDLYFLPTHTHTHTQTRISKWPNDCIYIYKYIHLYAHSKTCKHIITHSWLQGGTSLITVKHTLEFSIYNN